MIDCIAFCDMTGGTGKAGSGEALTVDVLAAHAAAVQEQLLGPFADAWDSAPARCRVGAPGGTDVGPNERLMGYWQTPDQPGAAGYHTVDPKGRPYGKVFLDDAATLSSGAEAASVIASHEALEMTLDPTATLFALNIDGTLYAYEASDAVEDTTYTASNNVTVSNFLHRAFFDPGAPPPYDHLGLLKAPFTTTPGGYQISGTASIGGFRVKAAGPGLSNPVVLARKSRPTSRGAKRKAIFPKAGRADVGS